MEESWDCGDMLLDERDGNTYTTVQIGLQCWMAENLNIGFLINGGNDQTDNEQIEKYCYGNVASNCDIYGGLYQWNEAMQYSNTLNMQGICMEGWRLPTDSEWCTLEQEVDPIIACNTTEWRGIDGGTKLKQGGSSGFDALLAGYYSNNSGVYGSFHVLEIDGSFWSSSGSGAGAWFRTLSEGKNTVFRNNVNTTYGFSVRCLQEGTSINQPPSPPSNPKPENGSTNIPADTTLSWSCSDPDGDPLTYDVYFGMENSPGQVTTEQTETTFDPGILEYDTEYFWKIVAHDEQGNSTEGEVWSFTTDSLEVGDNFGGGILAYILQPGDPGFVEGETHGFIAAPFDQSNGTEWGCHGVSIPGADGITLGTGHQNTVDIVAGCSTAGIAARVCYNLELNGYDDWFLPSKDELNKLYQNKFIIGGFTTDFYWSSSEASYNDAWSNYFINGFQNYHVKHNDLSVRAIRAF